MELVDVKSLIENSMNDLFEKDHYLIEHNLNERTIAAALTWHLKSRLKSSILSVDLEYNNDVENVKYLKTIFVLSERLFTIGEGASKQELRELSVFPDIIVHERGTNDNNTVVIEIKKKFESSKIDDKFDRLKLEHYTSNINENNLRYEFGVYLEIDTRTKENSFRASYYKTGALIV